MSSHTRWTMAHDFYYKGVDRNESHEYCGCPLSYRASTAISYSTAIAKVVPREGVRAEGVRTSNPATGLTLVSLDSMSSTTGCHISCVRQASPFKCVNVPLRRGCSDFTPRGVAENFLEALERLVGQLNTIDNRRKFVELLNCRREVMELACEEWARPLRDRRFRKYEAMDIEKMAKELQERNRKSASKRAAETKALFAKYLPKAKAGGADYCEFVHVLCNSWYRSEKFPFNEEQRSRLRAKLDRNAAYIWPDGDQICTSKGVRVSLDEARALLRAWALGKDMRMMRIGHYTIVRYEGDTIQIGCHKIPRENMLALYEAVVGKKFPGRAENRGQTLPGKGGLS